VIKVKFDTKAWTVGLLNYKLNLAQNGEGEGAWDIKVEILCNSVGFFRIGRSNSVHGSRWNFA